MNLAETLARKIGRVTELRAEYASVDKLPGVNVAPALFFMDKALEAAKVRRIPRLRGSARRS